MLTRRSYHQRSTITPFTDLSTRPSCRTSRKRNSPSASTPAWTVKDWRCICLEVRGFKSMSLPCYNLTCKIIKISFFNWNVKNAIGRKLYKRTHEVVNLVKKLIQLLTVNEANVAFSKEPSYLLFQLVFLNIQHYQYCC